MRLMNRARRFVRVSVVVFTGWMAASGHAAAQAPADPFGPGRALIEDGEYERAKAELTQRIAGAPNVAQGYALRGFVEALQEDTAAALADYGRAIALDPRDPFSYHARAYLEYAMHAWNDAAADFSKVAVMDPDRQGYAQLRLWLIRSQLGQKAAASRDLADFVKTYRGADDSQWVSTIALFLTDQISEPAFMELLRASGPGPDNRVQYPPAYFYAGAKRLLGGDRAGATDWFRQAISLGLDDDRHLDALNDILSSRAEVYGLAQLSTPGVLPRAPVRVNGTTIPQPQKTKDVKPRRPRILPTQADPVMVDATIDAAGKVRAVSVRRGNAGLHMVALDAVLQWEFAPTRVNGAPAPVVATVPVDFRCDEGGFAPACTDLGFRFENGRAVPRDDARAAALYQRGCDGDDALGCARLGILHSAGRGVPRNDATAVALLKKSCDGGTPIGCETLGTMYAAGSGVAKDEPLALTLYARACAAGDTRACTLKTNLENSIKARPKD